MFRSLAVLFPFATVANVFCQSVFAPPSGVQGASVVPAIGNISAPTVQTGAQYNNQPAAPINGQTGSEDQTQTNPGAEASGAEKPLNVPINGLMQWGALHLRPRTSYQFLYATGIHAEPGQPTDTYTHTVSPGLTVEIGPHVNLDYSPIFRFYSQRDFHDTIDHILALNENFGYGDWTFGASQGVTLTDEPLVQTSRQTRQTDANFSLAAVYHQNDKVSFSTVMSAGLVFVGTDTNAFTGSAEGLSDSQSYNVSEGVNYKINETITAGVSVGLGYSEQDDGFSSFNDQYNGTLIWHPGAKLTASIGGGLAGMHFLNSKAGAMYNPIYSVAIGYQILEATSLSLSASRTVGSSLFQNQTTDTTTIGIGFQQRLLGKMQLSLGFGYTRSDYTVVAVDLPIARRDEGFSYTAGLSVPFRKHLSFGTFYTYNQNTSSEGGFGFSSNQVGVSLSWVQ